MANTRYGTARNQTLEICKLVASVFVVFLHVPIPGRFGSLLKCLSRFAVPMFFAISGYFSYQAGPEKLVKRMKQILRLELIGILIYGCWKCVQTAAFGGSFRDCLYAVVPGGQELALWLLLNVDPFAGHLWYLSAAAVCYGALWLYVHFFRSYRPLYVLCGFLLAAHFAMGEFSQVLGIEVDFRLYRNAVFFGLPMFAMGLFLREHRGKLAVAPAKLLAGMLAAVGLSIAEWWVFGGKELYIGAVLLAALVILFAESCPAMAEKSWLGKGASRCGTLSTTVYILHLAVHEIYLAFFQGYLERWTGTAEPWLAPVWVVLVSLLAAAVWERLYTFLRTAFKR